MPPVFVGDEAFPLWKNLMRPYPGKNLSYKQRVFNYRLSRARRIVENAFGILASRFRVFRRPLLLQPQNADAVIKGAVVLHNFLRKEAGSRYLSPLSVDHESENGDVVPGEWRQTFAVQQQLLGLLRSGRRNSSRAVEVRDTLADYFVSAAGAVSWQNERVNRI